MVDACFVAWFSKRLSHTICSIFAAASLLQHADRAKVAADSIWQSQLVVRQRVQQCFGILISSGAAPVFSARVVAVKGVSVLASSLKRPRSAATRATGT